MLEIIIAGLFIMAASLVGILFTNSFARKYTDNNLPLLLAFSTGVFFVAAGLLIIEVFHVIEIPILAVALVGVGYGLATALQHLLPESHHHHDHNCANTAGAKKVIVGDAIHNITDGIILVPAFLASTGLGIMVVFSIFIHELLQEIAEFFVLKRAGYSTQKAILINFAVSSTIFIGIGIGLLSLSSELLEGTLLAISAGFFVHVVLHDLIPEIKESHVSRTKTLVMLILGVLLMLGINTVLSEEHEHGEAKSSKVEEQGREKFVNGIIEFQGDQAPEIIGVSEEDHGHAEDFRHEGDEIEHTH